jgi:UDP-apiose/xylose synthase
MKICLLGGGGFLGSHLVKRLLDTTDHRLVVIDPNTSRINYKHPNLTFLKHHFTEGNVIKFVRESELFISMMALCNPALYNTKARSVLQANCLSLAPIVRQCALTHTRLIQFSTCEVYGSSDEPMHEDTSKIVLGPVSASRWTYATAKHMLERVIHAHGQEENLEYTIVRPFNVIGPRMDFMPGVDGEGIPRVVACFMHALLKNNPIMLVDGGKARRSFLDVEDFTTALCRIIERPKECNGQIINIGSARYDITIADLAERLVKAFKNLFPDADVKPFVSVPGTVFYGPGYEDAQRRIPSTEKSKRLLDWEAQTPLSETLERIVTDYATRYSDKLKKE